MPCEVIINTVRIAVFSRVPELGLTIRPSIIALLLAQVVVFFSHVPFPISSDSSSIKVSKSARHIFSALSLHSFIGRFPCNHTSLLFHLIHFCQNDHTSVSFFLDAIIGPSTIPLRARRLHSGDIRPHCHSYAFQHCQIQKLPRYFFHAFRDRCIIYIDRIF